MAGLPGGGWCSRETLVALGLGQFVSLIVTSTGLASSELSRRGINVPTSQSLLNYLLLGVVYGGILIRRRKPLQLPSEREDNRAPVVLVVAADQGRGGDGSVPVVLDSRKEADAKGNVAEAEGRKKMSSRSDIWNHFDKIKVNGILQKGKCKYCRREIAAHPVHNGTSAMRRHFSVCKRNPHRNNGDDKQAVLQVNQGDSVHAWKFDPDAIRAAFIAMIIEDELPFAFGEKSGFRKFMSVACPRFKLPSRRTCTRDVVGTYFEQKAKLQLFFRDNCERVCLTTDMWTSQQQDSFMTVTAHFICKEWKLHKKVIGFFQVKGHKGDDIGKNLQKTLIDWGIEKVMTITVDNASSNDGGIAYMKKELNKAKTSVLEGKYLHMRCAAHIVNLIVSDGLKELELSIKRVRAAVRYIRNSTTRIAKFKECVVLEKIDTKAFLNLDVSTRWNSTYFMLKAATCYEKVFTRYADEDPYFAIDLLTDKGKETGVGVPDDQDWENVRKMANFLGHFADLTSRVSATLHVTANNFFHEIGEVNLLVKSWMESGDDLQCAMAQRMKEKYDKYWGNWHEPDPTKKVKENINLLIFVATALDPRYKLSEYTHFAILEMYGDDKGSKVWATVNNCIKELFEEYRIKYAPKNIESAESVAVTESTGGRASMMRSLIAKRMRMNNGSSCSSKSELEKFLAEETEDDHAKFDILAWWKINSNRFPVLACLARDVLAIPISSVASESAFSTGGRVLDDFRTSLTPFMVEALVCTQDWLRHSTPVCIAENTEELSKLEQVVKAYQYTSLTSVMLLDCWAIPAVIFLTWMFLKTKYRFRKYSGVAICVTGLVLVVFSDVHTGDRAGGTSPVKGDILVIAGATLYAISNVSEEFLVKAGDRIELMGMMGLFGAIISACQISIFERNEIKSIQWSTGDVVLFIGFAVAMFMFYSLVPILLKISGSTLLNLSLLTSDMWAILIRVFAYHEKVDWMYYVAFGAVAVGLVTYSGDTAYDKRQGQVGGAGQPDEEAAGDPRCLDAASSSSPRFEDGKGHYHALVNDERGVQEEMRVSRE